MRKSTAPLLQSPLRTRGDFLSRMLFPGVGLKRVPIPVATLP